MALIPRLQAGFRLMAGEYINRLTDAVNGWTGGTSAISVTDETQNGVITTIPQVLAAAGATQGAAGAITKSTVIVTVTASTQGVKLPTAATGKRVTIFMPGTVGVKVYPGTNGKIDASSTNVAVVLAAGKANLYIARDTTRWVTMKGA